jgi:hypothetical protein
MNTRAETPARDRAGPNADILLPGAPLSAYVGARVQF